MTKRIKLVKKMSIFNSKGCLSHKKNKYICTMIIESTTFNYHDNRKYNF